MQELAEAFASALAEAVIACDVVGSGGVCALAAADINATIWAAAEVFALGFASATGTCAVELCEVDALIVTEAIAEVVSSAAASALAFGCAGMNAPFLCPPSNLDYLFCMVRFTAPICPLCLLLCPVLATDSIGNDGADDAVQRQSNRPVHI